MVVIEAAKVVIISELAGINLHFDLKQPSNSTFFPKFALRNETKKVFHPDTFAVVGAHRLFLWETLWSRNAGD